MSITEWKASLTPRRNYTPIQSIPHLLMLERHASEKDIYVRDILEYFSVSDFCEQRKTNTWQHRETVSLSDAPWVGSSFRLLQNEIIGGVREGEIARCEIFWQTRQTLACVRPFFFFPQDELYAASPAGESECSGPRAVVSHPEERLDGLPNKAQNAAPKTVT